MEWIFIISTIVLIVNFACFYVEYRRIKENYRALVKRNNYLQQFEKYKNECNWFLFFDFDEYLYMHFQPNVSLTLQEFLPNKMFDKCEAILFNWLIYTDNDLIYYDNRTLLERFPVPNYNVLDNIVVKSIIRGNSLEKLYSQIVNLLLAQIKIFESCLPCKSSRWSIQIVQPFRIFNRTKC